MAENQLENTRTFRRSITAADGSGIIEILNWADSFAEYDPLAASYYLGKNFYLEALSGAIYLPSYQQAPFAELYPEMNAAERIAALLKIEEDFPFVDLRFHAKKGTAGAWSTLSTVRLQNKGRETTIPSVTGGVSVNISPIDLGINYDTSENAVSVAGGAEIPGGLLGVSGGVTIDLDTGEVTGGSVGAEGLGLGVNISASKDGGLGVGITVQIPFTPIELQLGFGFPPKEKEPIPTPAPEPPSSPGDGSDGGKVSAEDLEKIDPRDTIYIVGVCKGEILLANVTRRLFIQGTWYIDFGTNRSTGRPTLGKINAGLFWNGYQWGISRASYDWEANPPPRIYYAKYGNQHSYQLIGLPYLPEVGDWIETQQYVDGAFSYAVMTGKDFKASLIAEVQPSTLCPGGFPR